MTNLLQKQPAPKANDEVSSWDYVIESYLETRDNYFTGEIVELMRERNEFGIKKHGTALQPDNGRDSLADAFQEVLDSVVYVQNAILEGKDVDYNLMDVKKKLLDIIEIICMVQKENGG